MAAARGAGFVAVPAVPRDVAPEVVADFGDAVADGLGFAAVEGVPLGVVVVAVAEPAVVAVCSATAVPLPPATVAGPAASMGRVARATAPTMTSDPAAATSAVRRLVVLRSGPLLDGQSPHILGSTACRAQSVRQAGVSG